MAIMRFSVIGLLVIWFAPGECIGRNHVDHHSPGEILRSKKAFYFFPHDYHDDAQTDTTPPGHRRVEQQVDDDDAVWSPPASGYCEQEAAISSSPNTTCTCNAFDDGVVELSCLENCLYCGKTESSSCGQFSSATNLTDGLAFNIISYATRFRYDGTGGRNELISVEEIDCNGIGDCTACRVLVNGTQCNSCTLCSSGAGAIVDCENIVEGSSFNSCVSPPGPGLFEGFFDYDVVECVVPPPPPNDNCTSAIPIVPGDVVSGTLTGALEDNVSSCRTFDTGSHGVWYSFEGTGTPVLLSTCSESNTNSVGLVSVHQGSGCDLLECSDGSSQFYCSGYSGGSSMLVPTEAGATYYVFVSGWDGSFGTFDLSLTAFPEQSNDKCPSASEISVDGGPVVATIDFRESQRARLGVCSLDVVENYGIAWYRFEAVQDATLRASTCTTTGNTGTVGWMSTITITSGVCEALACIEQSELHAYYETCSDGGTYVDFTVAAGNSYGVAVWGSGYADVGLLELDIQTLNPPSNDNCQGAQLINVTSNFTGVFRDVTLSSEESIGVCFEQIGTSKSGGIWYSFVGTGDVIVATACSNDFTPYLTMHTGSCSDLECVSPATWNAPSSCSSFLYGQQTVPIETVDGTVYFVLVSGSGPISGSFGLSFRTVLPVENDSCSNAIDVKADGQVIIGNTAGAIYEEFTNDCPYTSSSPGVWYSVVGNGGMLKADTCSPVTNFDTAISVYRGSCEDLQCVGTNDDGCQSLSSSFTWSTEAGETYYILVSGLSDEQTGDYGFKVAPFVPASNDECAGAINVAVGGVLTGTMKGASSYNESYACYSGYDRPTLWYTIEGTGTALKVSTCAPNSTFYGGIQAFEGTSCSDLECSGLIYEGGGYSDNDCPYPSAATFFFAEEGVQYSIMLIDDSFGGENSTFSLTVTEIDLAPNDECETASLIGVTENEVIQGSTIKSLPDNVTCEYYNSNAPGVWYSVMGTGNTLVASTCSRPIHFDGSIFVFSGACGAQECVAVGPSGYGSCGDSFNAGSRVPFRTQVGVEYYILVTGSYPSAVGDFSLSLSDAISPPNDVCSDAISVTPDSGVIKGSLTNATSFFGSNYSCAYDQTAVTVWYSVMGTGDVLVISTCSDQLNFDSAISVSTGTCDDQSCVTFNAYACTETSFSGARVSVRTEVGVEYFIAVEGLNFPSRGDFALTVSTLQAPINDECPGAIALQPDEGAITRSIANATGYLDYNSSVCSYNYDAPDVWYSMIGTGEVLLLSTCSSVLNFDTSLSVSKGSCDRQECVVYDTYGYSGCTESTYSASRAVFRTEAGVEYFIAVQGVNYPLEGEFTLELSTVQPPVNDECSGAIMVQPANKTIIGSLANATGTLGFNTSCEYSSGSPGIWYSMIGTGDVYSISTCSSDLTVDTALSVSTGSCGNQTCIVTGAYNEYDCTETSYSAARVIFRTEVGVEYFIQVQGLTASAQGRFALDLSTVVVPVNDACIDATSISTETVSGSITNATDFDGFINYCSYSFGAPDVWYTLMGTGEAFAVSTCSSVLDFDAALTVSTGSCINQTCITSGAYNYQTCEIGSYSAARVVFRTEVGVEYFISVQGANYPTEGKFELQISTIEIPNNDECIDALAIVPGEGPIFGSTSVATYDGTNSSCSGYDTSPDLWYRVEGTGKKLSASTCGVRTNYDSLVSIFEAVGEECDTTCIETSNDFCGSGSKVEWFANEGVTYYIRVHGYSTSSGSFVLRLTSA